MNGWGICCGLDGLIPSTKNKQIQKCTMDFNCSLPNSFIPFPLSILCNFEKGNLLCSSQSFSFQSTLNNSSSSLLPSHFHIWGPGKMRSIKEHKKLRKLLPTRNDYAFVPIHFKDHSPIPSVNLAKMLAFFLSIILLFISLMIFPMALAEMKDGNQAEIKMEFIKMDQICILCHSVISRWKAEMAKQNGTEQLKMELLTSCLLLQNATEVKQCTDGIKDAKLERLKKEGAERICESEGICGKGQLEKAKKEQKKDKKAPKKLATIPDVKLMPPQNATLTNETTEIINIY